MLLKLWPRAYPEWRGVLMKDEHSCRWIFRFHFTSTSIICFVAHFSVLNLETIISLQVLINGLKHFVSFDVRPKLQIVETFIKVNKLIILQTGMYLSVLNFQQFKRSHYIYRLSTFQKPNTYTGPKLIRYNTSPLNLR